MEAYKRTNAKIAEYWENTYLFQEIKVSLATRQIYCKKFNYGIDDSVSSYSSFESVLFLSEDESEVVIMNRIPKVD